MAQLESWFSNANGVDRPVVDETGLIGPYDFTLEWSNPLAGDSLDSATPSIFAAMPEQQGFRLEPRRGPLEVLVIDHADMPGSNGAAATWSAAARSHADLTMIVPPGRKLKLRRRAAKKEKFRAGEGMEKDGMRRAAALRSAQIKMIPQKQCSRPFFWAAIEIQGEWQ